jgi:membrane dipeptidase
MNPAQPFPTDNRQADRIVVDGLDTSIINTAYLELIRAGRVDCVHKTTRNIVQYGAMHRFIAGQSRHATIARSVADIRQAKRDGRIAFVLGNQDANELERLLEKGTRELRSAPFDALRSYYELGLRIQGLCYNVNNIWGGGCLEPRSPLTREGVRLVEQIHALGILLDVGGHTGEQTSLDALAISTGVPVVCTHTNVAALNANARATSDRVLEAIARTGGVIGVTAISDFHTRNAANHREHGARSPQVTLEAHLDHYDYLKRLVGADHVGLGPDFVWGWGENFHHDAGQSLTFPPESLSDGIPQLVQGFENISHLPNVVAGLRGRGWSESELDAVLGGNWLRVYERAWGA